MIDTPARAYLQSVIGLDNPEANGFAKWFLSLNLGYEQILQGIAGSLGAA